MYQDVDVWVARCAPEEHATHRLKPSRHAFVQVARGAAMLNGVMLNAGDGAAISQEEILEFKAVEDADKIFSVPGIDAMIRQYGFSPGFIETDAAARMIERMADKNKSDYATARQKLMDMLGSILPGRSEQARRGGRNRSLSRIREPQPSPEANT